MLSNQSDQQPNAILVLIPRFYGGPWNFYLLADNLLRKAREENLLVLKVCAIDSCSNALEETPGLDIAEETGNLSTGLDFIYGEVLGTRIIES